MGFCSWKIFLKDVDAVNPSPFSRHCPLFAALVFRTWGGSFSIRKNLTMLYFFKMKDYKIESYYQVVYGSAKSQFVLPGFADIKVLLL